MVDVPWRNFLILEFGQFPEGRPLFLEMPKFLKTQCRIKLRTKKSVEFVNPFR